MRHPDEPFVTFGSIFSVTRLRIVFADTLQRIVE